MLLLHPDNRSTDTSPDTLPSLRYTTIPATVSDSLSLYSFGSARLLSEKLNHVDLIKKEGVEDRVTPLLSSLWYTSRLAP